MSDFQPIVPNLLPATTALTNKYSATGDYQGAGGQQLLASLNALPTPQAIRPAATANTITPLALYDQARANRGLTPLTPRQSARALQTLRSGQPATKPRSESFYRSLLSDARALVGGVVKLPVDIAHEVERLDELPAAIPAALARSSNPLAAVGNLAALPGLRMIPGSFVAQNLLGDEGQGVAALKAHPLFTALDVLPLASGAAKVTKVASAAEDAYRAQVESLVNTQRAAGLDPSTTILPRAPRPLRTALTRQLTPSGSITPNLLGRGIADLADSIKSTKYGSTLAATFRERATPRIITEGDTFLREAADPRIPTTSLRPNVPGGRASMIPELAIRDLTTDIRQRLEPALQDAGLTPEQFYDRVALSETPDGTPIPPEQMTDLTPELRVIARDTRDAEYAAAVYTDALPGPQSTRTVSIDGRGEVYDYRTAQRLSKAQAIETSAREVADARTAALTPAQSTLTSTDIQERLTAIPERVASGELTKKSAANLTALYDMALEGSSRPDIARIIPTLRPLAREFPTIPRLIDHLQNGRWAAANKDMAALARTRHGRSLLFDIGDARAELSRLVARDRVLSRTSHVDEAYVNRATKLRARVESRTNPARFDPLIERAARESTRARVNEVFTTHPDLDKFIAMADRGIYDTLIAADPRFTRWVREDQAAARQSWQALRDAGHDPVFMARVTPAQAARQAHPRISDRPVSLQSVKARMMDAAPYVKDVAVVLNQQSLDILSRRGTQAALDRISSTYGKTRADLTAMYQDRLLASEASGLTSSAIPSRTRLAQMIERRWTPFNPGDYGGSRPSTFNVESASTIYIPREMATNLRKMFDPKPSTLTSIFDKPMNAFRTSVLPLAIRWQINNGVSGVIVSAVEDPRAFLEMPNVIRDMWGERKALPEAADRMRATGMPPAGIGSMTPEMLRWADEVHASSPLKDRVAASAQFTSGTTLRNLYDAARDSRLSKITDTIKHGIEKSYDANQFVDDVFRSSMGRAKMKKYLGKGYSEDAASALTASSIRRVFQAWDEMTPMERSVMRSIVPFYGFAAYATRFVLHYPFDHPLRVSVLTSLADAELHDSLTGLPEHIRDMILLGDPRANSMVRALNVSPFNPFGGVPSMFTVAGFTGQLNPIITGVLESIGVDVQQGGPQLYPELRYDPETGRLIADPSGNVFSNIIGNTIPQVSGVTALLGWNDAFNDTLRRDPAAAGRMLLSNFGVPILYKDVNIGDQLIKAEMARLQDEDTARRNALTSGDLSVLNDFPGLRAYGEQIRALDAAGKLDQLRPTAGQPGAAPSDTGNAYALQAALTG